MYYAPSGLVMDDVLYADGLYPSLAYVAPSGLVIDELYPSLSYSAPSGLNMADSPERAIYDNMGHRPVKWQRHKTPEP